MKQTAIQLLLVAIVFCSIILADSIRSHFYGNVDKLEDLNRAIDVASMDGNLILVAVDARGKTQHLLTALNTIHNLRHEGRSDNVFLLTGGEVDCRFMKTQRVVPVRVCTWSDQLKNASDWWDVLDASNAADRIWHLRLHFFNEILQTRPKIGLLMTDTDVCYSGNPFPALEALNKSVVMNGNADGLNIGLVYARKSDVTPPDTMDLFKEISRRLRSFRQGGVGNAAVKSRNSRVYWDQNLVNDVLQEFVTGVPTYFRSCWIGFGETGDNATCFADCCKSSHPFGLKPGQRDEVNSMAWYIHKNLVPFFKMEHQYKPAVTTYTTRPEIGVTNLGGCNKPNIPFEHENQCRNDTLKTKLDWMKWKNCWYEPLDSLPEIMAKS